MHNKNVVVVLQMSNLTLNVYTHRVVKWATRRKVENTKWLTSRWQMLFEMSNRLQQFCALMFVSGDVINSRAIPDHTWPDVYRCWPNSVYTLSLYLFKMSFIGHIHGAIVVETGRSDRLGDCRGDDRRETPRESQRRSPRVYALLHFTTVAYGIRCRLKVKAV